ncbi:MAG: hypothetical protein ACRD1B_11330, partial [Thermoanaerobaculia bacterium]
MHYPKKPTPILLVALLTALVLSAIGCPERYWEKKGRVPVVAVDLSVKDGAPYPTLYKHKGHRLIWFADHPRRLVVHVGSKPVPFADMVDGSSAPCAGGGDCEVHCYPDGLGSVCVSGKIIIEDKDLPAAGIQYDYEAPLLTAAGKAADPGF